MKGPRVNPSEMTREQAEVFKIFGDTVAKFMLAMATGIVFFVITIKLVVDPGWPVASAEAVLGGVVTIVFRHYFPGKQSASRRKPSVASGKKDTPQD